MSEIGYRIGEALVMGLLRFVCIFRRHKYQLIRSAHGDELSCFHCDKEVRFYRVLDFREGRKRSSADTTNEGN